LPCGNRLRRGCRSLFFLQQVLKQTLAIFERLLKTHQAGRIAPIFLINQFGEFPGLLTALPNIFQQIFEKFLRRGRYRLVELLASDFALGYECGLVLRLFAAGLLDCPRFLPAQPRIWPCSARCS
jgi:hypothetical protein